ncbi:class I SAM-dependent methyltransferase [Paramagnetospirillum magneticum]|uniref:class I SAM-dependent methyltransferase n=1 Tax=Paramagnetospirillum magneticum TaxID=84159 RepID=UPI001E2D73DD|nr:class I SAM-dependent methyltransferase [Paramagnetospirillum magneticum]
MLRKTVDNAPAPTPVSARIPYTACPLCASGDFAALGYADCTHHPLYQDILPAQMVWCRCNACAHVFTDGYFTEAAARVIFSKTNESQAVGHDAEGQRRVSARIVERVARHVSGGDWLDVGFGNGSLLFTAQEFGFGPVGTDLRSDGVAALAALGYEAYCQPLEQLDMPGRFAVISMADVLEHMPYPRTALDKARSLLRPDGAIFVSMPNMSSMVWRLLDQQMLNPYWPEIEHYHNFSRERLYALLEDHGFTPVNFAVSERYRVCMEVIAIRK